MKNEDIAPLEDDCTPAAKKPTSPKKELVGDLGEKTGLEGTNRPPAECGAPPDASRTSLPPRKRIDEFRILRRIGRGGQGDVFLARDCVLGRRVALKFVATSETLDSAELTQREARALATLSHPNIITVFRIGLFEGRPYLALEYVEGEVLRERMMQGPMQRHEAMRVSLSIAEALAAAHAAGVIHRDLKPANVMLDRSGHVRVLDFGVAGFLHELQSLSTNRPRELVGTPGYMAPEQWRGDARPATDIWALGVIMHELMTGERLFCGSPGHIQKQVQEGTPYVSPPEIRDFPALVRLIERCLDRDDSARPTAEEIVAEFSTFVQQPITRSIPVSPFRGLLTFTEREASVFYGRDRETIAALEHLRDSGALLLVGPSGTGKSSLVRAGIVPRLMGEGMWSVRRFRPGADPLQALAVAFTADHSSISRTSGSLSSLGAPDESVDRLAETFSSNPEQLMLRIEDHFDVTGRHTLLIVDQLEEAHALVSDPDIEVRFLEILALLAQDPGEPVRVILTLRDDFLGRMRWTAKSESLLWKTVLVSSPEGQALLETIVGPLRERGFEFDDPELPAELIRDAGTTQARLPLMQFALSQIWEERDQERRKLRADVYRRAGSLAGMLATHADQFLSTLRSHDLQIAREMLLGLVTPERTRRVLRQSQLTEGKEALQRILERLVESRLVVARGGGESRQDPLVELAHESLTVSWPRLARWLEESSEELRIRDQIEQAAEIWRARERPDEVLWTGLALQGATTLVTSGSRSTLSGLSREFLGRSIGRDRKLRRRRRTVAAAAAALLLLIAVASISVAFELARREAKAVSETQKAQYARFEAVLAGARSARARAAMLEARALTRRALELNDSTSARFLWQSLESEPVLWTVRSPYAYYDGSLSPDGKTIAVGSQPGMIELFDVNTTKRQIISVSDQIIRSVQFRGDNRLLAGDAGGLIHLVDPQTGEVSQSAPLGHELYHIRVEPTRGWIAASGQGGLTVLRGDSLTSLWHVAASWSSAEWLSDGTLVVAGGDFLELRDGATGEVRSQVQLRSTAKEVVVAGTPPAIMTVHLDGTVSRWSTSLELLAQTPPLLQGASFLAADPHNRFWLVSRRENSDSGISIVIWNVERSKVHMSLRDTQERSYVWLRGAVFDEAGKWVAMSLAESVMRIQLLPQRDDTQGEARPVWDMCFDPTEQSVLSLGEETATRWNIQRPEKTSTRVGHFTHCAGYTRKGQLVLCDDSSYSLLDPSSLSAIESHPFPTQTERHCILSPDGQEMITYGDREGITFRRLADGAVRLQVAGPGVRSHAVDIDARGRRLTAAGDNRVWIIDTTDGRAIHELPHPKSIDAVFLPDGVVASTGRDRRVRFWNSETGKLIGNVSIDSFGFRLAARSDGTLFVAGNQGLVSEIGPDRRLRGTKRIHPQDIDAMTLSADGAFLATGSNGGAVAVVDLRSRTSRWFGAGFVGEPAVAVTHERTSEELSATGFGGALARPIARIVSNGEEGCVLSAQGAVEAWRKGGSSPEKVFDGFNITDLALMPAGGCVGVGSGRAVFLDTKPDPTVVDGILGASTQGSKVVLVLERRVDVCGPDGRTCRQRRVPDGVIAATWIDEFLLLGYGEGSVERVSEQETLTLERVSGSRPSRFAVGPRGTVAIGHEDGTIGLWSLESGQLLSRALGNGSVIAIDASDPLRILALTDLGDEIEIRADALGREYCSLLRDIGRQVPVAFEEGRFVETPMPSDHRCAATAPRSE